MTSKTYQSNKPYKKVVRKPIKKVVEEIEEELEEDELIEEDEEEDSESELSEEDETDTDSDYEHDEDNGGKTLNVQWLQKIEQNQRKLEKKITDLANNQPDIQGMITETIQNTLSGMSIFKIAPQTPKKKPHLKSGADQRVVKTEVKPVKKPLFSKRKK